MSEAAGVNLAGGLCAAGFNRRTKYRFVFISDKPGL